MQGYVPSSAAGERLPATRDTLFRFSQQLTVYVDFLRCPTQEGRIRRLIATINRYDLIDVDHDNALLVISFQAASTSGEAPL
jgi:hypothetical protein